MREFNDKDLEISSADYITLPQIREKVRNYFADHK
jgi:hypothetical protein